jgi:hypothetical protein
VPSVGWDEGVIGAIAGRRIGLSRWLPGRSVDSAEARPCHVIRYLESGVQQRLDEELAREGEETRWELRVESWLFEYSKW